MTYGLVRLAYGLLLPDVQADLGLGTAAAGRVSSAASLAYCLGAVTGFLAAEQHPRLLVLAAGLTAVVGSAGMAAADGPLTFSVAAVVGSTAAGLASPAMVRLVDRNVRPQTRERDQTSVNAGTGPGLVAAGALALLLLPDWRLAWALAAVAALVATAAVLLLDEDRAPVETPVRRRTTPDRRWLMAHRHAVASAFVMGTGSAAVWSFGRSLLVEGGSGERTSVLAWVALGIGGAAVIATARPMVRLGTQASWAVSTLSAAAATAALALAPGSAVLALGACALFGWGFTAATGALIAGTSEIDGARAAAGTSLLFVVLVLGQASGSSLVGGLAAGVGFGPAFLGAALVLLGAGLLPQLARRRRGDPRHARASTY
ncbi:MFS transporter [Aeromicrobium sp. Leaf350]|uniref:MFS transporter n=1 Tax=Aeromicrobium sp. Leaf350 TaxID=2876565 RepID=UPI001E4D1C8E|nr:MFS transporter [Aeromicrobium sp. Leaf350]